VADTITPELLDVLNTLPEPRVLLSPDYRILAVNRAYQQQFGHGQSVLGRPCYSVSHRFTKPCDQAGESCPLQLSRETGHPQRTLHLHFTPRGEEHVDVDVAPIRSASGDIRYFLETSRVIQSASSRPESLGLVGRSEKFMRMLELVERVATSDASVLLLGESGTGKELVAQALHDASKRAKEPFVAVECSGLSETLFESELFGYEKGAFTGAQSRKTGLVESAAGGTLFLDEVGDIPLNLQVKLLRLLETGTYRRVGGVEVLRADFRLVCATHRDLKAMVKEGTFRRDLYYRIGAFPIQLPALRERLEDLPLLAEALLRRITPQRTLRLDPDSLKCLARHGFPGNIRELRNMLERASLLADGDVILPVHLPDACGGEEMVPPERPAPFFEVVPLEEMERRYLQWVLRHAKGDRKALAERLGLSARTLYRKLQDIRKG
jgi:two-component system response regulator HydG